MAVIGSACLCGDPFSRSLQLHSPAVPWTLAARLSHRSRDDGSGRSKGDRIAFASDRALAERRKWPNGDLWALTCNR